jgi:hypothetical protein
MNLTNNVLTAKRQREIKAAIRLLMDLILMEGEFTGKDTHDEFTNTV